MKLIAHRGNMLGPNPKLENSPEYIDDAIKNGFEVEIDLRLIDGQLFLGHDYDGVLYLINWEFLYDRQDSLWIHCKDAESLEYCLDNSLRCFYHNVDQYTMTSNGLIWAYPGSPIICNTIYICVLPEEKKQAVPENIYGVCSDYVKEYINV